MNLKIASLNINGFRSKFKHKLITQFVTQNKIDILHLQETFVDNTNLAKNIEERLQSVNCVWNFGKANSCGVAILLFNENICIEKYHLDFFGRVICLDFSLNGFENFRITNAYFPTESTDRLEFISMFSQYLLGARNVILAGDFNFVLDTNLDKMGGNLNKGTIGSKSFKNILEKANLIDCFRHLYPQKRAVTWIRQKIGTRIDRFYISSFIKGMISGFETLPCSCSDHSFVVLSLVNTGSEAVTFGKSYWKFNDSLLEDNDFLTSFKFYWDLISNSGAVTLDWWDKMKENIRLFCIEFSRGKNKRLFGRGWSGGAMVLR